MDKYNEFPQETKLWSWAMAREDGRKAVASRIHESHEDGIREGLKEGMAQGLQRGLEKGIKEGLEKGMEQGMEKVVLLAIKKKYHQEANNWLESLTPKQIENIMEVLLEVDDFTTFKQVVEKGK